MDQADTRKFADTVMFNVLGPISATEGDETLSLGGTKQRTVLAMLVAHSGQPVSADRLIEAVYGEEAASGARRTIQTYVSALRSVVGDAIQRVSGGWKFAPPRNGVDALVFEDLLETARSLDGDRSSILRQALALWRGLPYADVEAHGYLDSEITRLNELRVAAQIARLDADLDSGHHAELISEIETLLAEHPYRERFRAQHMLALYRAGRQTEALRSYAAMRTLLGEELGIEPSPDLQELEQRILDHDPSLAAPTPTSITRRAVLVADPGDPMEIARLEGGARERLLEASEATVQAAAEDNDGQRVGPAGTAIYALFEHPTQAASAARDIAGSSDGGLRIAIDWGDVEIDDGGVAGPPVSRAARIVAAAHRGQVLISSEAQKTLTESSQSAGLRFEALGEYDLSGLDHAVAVFQLLVGEPPATFPPLVTDRIPPPLPGLGHRSVPGYELREPMGTGSVGTAYRAYQPSVGREVIVEVIGRALSSDPDFIRHFEADVQRLSLLEHPNLLTILDYWRDPDGAFIVYPYHRGGLLADSLDNVDEAELLSQVGSALAYAHSYGLVHGRISSARILLDEGGNAYLFGFPIAGSSTPDPDAMSYLPPDSTGGTATAEDDIYALGVVAHVIRTGSEVDPDRAPLDVTEVTGGATTIEALLSYLIPGRAERPGTRLTSVRNPYKGLAAFHESDAGDFFGRVAVVEELVDALADEGLVAVVGPSGIGKSSVVRAGLIPSLRQGAVPGSDEWLITDMLPGSHPFRELERALERVAVELTPGMREAIAEGGPDIFDDLDAALPGGSSLLLVVDQFEELFTMTAETTARRFLDLLVAASDESGVRIVLTMRADFLDRPLLYSEFGELLRRGLVTLRSPNDNELAEAIARPAENVGVTVEAGLVERLSNDVVDQPGALPLLQHTMAELFATRTSDLIDRGAFEGIGGVTGSIAKQAESVYAALTEGEQRAAKQALLRMVTISEESSPTRRRVGLAELQGLSSVDFLDGFARKRLVVFDSDPVTRTPTAEIAHEALITHWPRLDGWVEDLREDLVLRRRLDESLDEWLANDRADTYLLSAARLAQHHEWTGTTELALTELEAGYLEASATWNQELAQKRRRRRSLILSGFGVAAVVAIVLAVLAQSNAGRAEANRLATASVDTVEDDPELALLLALSSARERADLSFEQRRALHAAIDRSHADGRIDHGYLDTAWTSRGWISPDGSLVLVGGEHRAPLQMYQRSEQGLEPLWTPDEIQPELLTRATFTADGDRVLVWAVWPGLYDQSVAQFEDRSGEGLYIFDAETGELLDRPGIPDECSALDEGEGVFADYSFDRGWAPPNAILARSGPPGTDVVAGWCFSVAYLAPLFPPFDPYPTLWWFFDPSTGEIIETHEDDRGVWWVAPTSDGSQVQIDHSTGTEILDRTTGEAYPMVLEGGTGTIGELSPQGGYFVSGSSVYAPLTGEKIADLGGVAQNLKGCDFRSFSSDGSLLAVGCDDARLLVFSTATGDLVESLVGHSGWVSPGTFTESNDLVVSGSADGFVRVWDLSDRAEIATIETGGGYYADSGIDIVGSTGVALIYPDETSSPFDAFRSIMTRHAEGELVSFDVHTGEIESRIPGVAGKVARISPDGTKVVAQSATAQGVGALHVFDLADGGMVYELPGLCRWQPPDGDMSDCGELFAADATDLAWSPDGGLIAMAGGSSHRLFVWDTSTRQLVFASDFLLVEPMSAVAFSPDGALVVVSSKTGMWIYDTSSWELVRPPITHTGRPSWVMRFTTDGSELVTAQAHSGDVRIYDTSTWEERNMQGGAAQTRDMAVSGDDSRVALADREGNIHVLDLQNGELLELISLDNRDLTNIEFIDGDRRLLISSSLGPIEIVTLDHEELIDIARSRIARTFTTEECAFYEIDPCPTLEELQRG